MKLIEIITNLGSGKLDLKDYVDSLFKRIESKEPEIKALIPGTYEKQRIDDEIASLAEKYPNPS